MGKDNTPISEGIQKYERKYMIGDFIVNTAELSEALDTINIYPVGDTQVGSAGFQEDLWDAWLKMVLADPVGYVVFLGDMVNNGLRNSKTNVYRELMQPFEQKEWLKRQIGRFKKGSFLGAIAGNHEIRSVNESDQCPLYDALCKHDLESVYRENLNAIKVSLGNQGGGKRVSYVVVLHHGLGGKKALDLGYQIEGCDVMITGHNHQPTSLFPARWIIDVHNNIVREAPFKHIVVPSFDKAGYAIRGAYKGQSSRTIPIISLSGKEKKVSIRWEDL